MLGFIKGKIEIIKKWNYRRQIKKTCFSCGDRLNVNGASTVNNNTVLGENVNFNGMTIIGKGKVTIGNNFHSGENCYIITENHNYDYGDSIPYDSKESVVKDVVIEDNVWLGIGVIILPGTYIHEGAIVQAGSTVQGNIEECAIVGGHPAKVFKFRDKEHYYSLKKEKRFF